MTHKERVMLNKSDKIAATLIHFKANVTSNALAAPAHRLAVVI